MNHPSPTIQQHLAEARQRGVSASSEIHGAEAPGPIFAALDAARESFLLLSILLTMIPEWTILLSFGIGWAFWKGMRSSLLAWSRLGRLHKIASEEQTEIETNRPQEREELLALYEAKGLQGALLEKVVDVLMADQDRLLRIMLQEELGVRLEEVPHPLVQGAFAAAGSAIPFATLFLLISDLPKEAIVTGNIACFAVLGAIFAKIEKNSAIWGLCWNAMIGSVTYVLTTTCMELLV